MTEAEWDVCTDPTPMLEFSRGRASDRKLRLFAVACCRRIWHLFREVRGRKQSRLPVFGPAAIEVAERLADNQLNITAVQVRGARRRVELALWPGDDQFRASVYCLDESSHAGAVLVCSAVRDAVHVASDEAAACAEARNHAALLREILGRTLFRPVFTSASWLAWNDATIPKMAQVIYGERAFDRLPLLADALEDAGCIDSAILAHCREPGEHVRGCWVVDLLLGKS